MQKPTSRWIAPLLILFAVTAIPVSAAVAAPSTPIPVFSICGVIPADAGTPASNPSGSMDMHPAELQDVEFDLAFIDLMITHHESAVVMAQVALTRADHPEILELAANIIGAQTAEIAQLNEWRDAWYPDAPEFDQADLTAYFQQIATGMMDMDGMNDHPMAGMDLASALISMCNAPEPFDLAFIDEMIPHHQSAIDMANVGLENSTHPELKELQSQIIDAQQSEIDQMSAWRTAWFGAGTPVAG